jgi:hypothetical protein
VLRSRRPTGPARSCAVCRSRRASRSWAGKHAGPHATAPSSLDTRASRHGSPRSDAAPATPSTASAASGGRSRGLLAPLCLEDGDLLPIGEGDKVVRQRKTADRSHSATLTEPPGPNRG